MGHHEPVPVDRMPERRPAGGVDDGLVGDEEADADTGKVRLGERAEVDDPLVVVEGLERRAGRAVEAEQPVRIVLEDQQVGVRGDGEQRAAGRHRQRDAGRVGEVGHEIERAWVLAARPDVGGDGGDGGHRLGAQTVGGLRHRHHLDAEDARRAGEADVARLGGEHHIVRSRTDAAQGDDHRLLAARGDHDRGGRDLDVLVNVEHPGDEVTDVAVGPPVLRQQPAAARRAETALAQVREIRLEVLVDVGGGVELVEGAAGGQGDRLREPARQLRVWFGDS
ncbi:hypothetical protein GCM10010199_37640 [Dactylosporangium roseum]